MFVNAKSWRPLVQNGNKRFKSFSGNNYVWHSAESSKNCNARLCLCKLHGYINGRHSHNISVAGLYSTLPFSLWSLMNLFKHICPVHSSCGRLEGVSKRKRRAEVAEEEGAYEQSIVLKFEFWMGLFYTGPLKNGINHSSQILHCVSNYFLVFCLTRCLSQTLFRQLSYISKDIFAHPTNEGGVCFEHCYSTFQHAMRQLNQSYFLSLRFIWF